MSLLTKILWLLAFVAATFCWMVLFEHGFGVKNFAEGARQELRELAARLTGGARDGSNDPQSAPVDSDPKTNPDA